PCLSVLVLYCHICLKDASPSMLDTLSLHDALPISHLYNDDIAPVQRDGRHWGAYNVFTMWANDVHSLGNYTFAIGLFALGLGIWQILLSLAIGASALLVILTLSSFIEIGRASSRGRSLTWGRYA